MRVLVVNNHTLHLHTIKKLFAPHDKLTYISYRQIGWYDLDETDVIVLTWSSSHSFAYKAFAKEVHLLQQARKVIIWICLWCELLIQSFGGIISKNTERIEWDLCISCEDDPKVYKVHEAHRYSITSLWDQLRSLANSEYGYEIIQHKSKPILGFQFHPEVMLPSNDGYYLFQRYTKKLFDDIENLPRVENEY
jgi:GMP synthase-like glutamine amidotransferase